MRAQIFKIVLFPDPDGPLSVMKPFCGTVKLILAKIFWNEIFFSDKISMLKPPLCLIIVHLEGSFHEKSSAVGINGLLDTVEFPW